MDIWVALQIVVLLLLIACSGFFSSSETILFSLDPLQVRRITGRKGRSGRYIEELLSDIPSLLSTILIGNVVVNVALASVGYSLAERILPSYSEQVSILGVTAVLLVFGEIGPKRVGLANAERLAPSFAYPLKLFKGVSLPLRYLLESVTLLIKDLLEPHGRHLSEEEYETVLDIGGEEGLLDEEEWGMVKAVTRLQDLKAADVMTPRVDLQGIDLNSPGETEELVELARNATKKTLLLYRGQIDNLEGFLDVRKFLLDPEHRLEVASFKPLYVPEISSLDKVWTQLQQQQRRNAVAVDEYGGVAGLITRGDVLEEITGEIYSDLNKTEPIMEAESANTWIVDPHFSLEDLNRKLGLNLQAEDSDRLSGWMAEQLGHIPQQDDVIEAQGCRVVVRQTRKQRVTRALIEKKEEEQAWPRP